MKKLISMLCAIAILAFSTVVVTAEKSVGNVTGSRNNKTSFANSSTDMENMPSFAPGDWVGFTVSGVSDAKYITVISFKNGADILNETTQYINQYDDVSGDTKEIAYLLRNIEPGIYVLNLNPGNDNGPLFTGYYQVIEPEAPVVEPVTSVTVAPTSKELEVGGEITLTATVLPEEATNNTVTWSSDNDEVATVDQTGKVKAVAEGTAKITATAGECTDTCTITVKAAAPVVIDVEDITLNETAAKVWVGKTQQLTATVLPEGATNKTVTWSSDNDEVATVDQTGKVTAIKAGTAIITATAGEAKAECTIKTVLCGDINGDGNVNALDRTFLVRHVAKWPDYAEDKINYDAADINDDGNVNALDRTFLVRHVAKWPEYATLPYKK